jgi:glutathione transport system permease protein
MFTYFVKRLLGVTPTLLIVAVLVFLFVHMLPGDPARLAAGQDADQETVELVRRDLGLDRPLHEQFVTYFTNILKGEFGVSLRSRRPVTTEIAERFMPTLLLTLTSMAWAIVFGMVIGIFSAVFRNEWPDRLGMAIAVSGISFPAFALGMLLMQVFSVQLGWLPTVGASTWLHYILPSITLGAAVAAVLARFTRASFVEVIREDFVRTARAKGLSERVVLAKHCLRNALDPGRHHDGPAVRIPARRLHRRRGGVQLARTWTPARRVGRAPRLSGVADPGAAVFLRVHSDQPDRRPVVRVHQSDHPLQVTLP